MRKFGPYTRKLVLGKIDGRSREAKLVRYTRNALIDHCGGDPNAVQTAMIDQVCQLTLRIQAMDRKFAESGEQTDHLDFAHHRPVRSGTDPEGRFRGDKVERFVEREDGAKGSRRTPSIAAPPQHFEAVVLRHRLQPGNRRAGAGR
jgi:hypothetical protein